ncbi:bifunctional methylenetetrahydrofolate dehydrogenase/methenyltetrahydrofolate cyclohydrolase FolD [Gammaproteobacteria bacterium]|nr:bifunctional methylenetetrahydrofolate dehydrogenase/methenyltetrahydrofolate cyclohydrolase FolD [Gammaproteobacteria bacterium]
MNGKIINGKQVANDLIDRIKDGVDKRLAAGHRAPGLAMVLVGDSPASKVYVRNKEKACERSGILSFMHRMPETTSQEELLALVDRLNTDDAVDGILVQLPLPDHIDDESVLSSIAPDKDADGFHPENMGLLAIGAPRFRPCTPRGIMTLLAHTGIDLAGLDAVIVGRSNIVGRPMALELIRVSATVTVCHSKTRDLPGKIGAADLVVAAIGRPEFVKGEWIKPGAIVIDVGINRTAEGKLVGDVEFEAAKARAAWITPVPGGVGPMTVASLLENTFDSAELRDPS